MTLVSLRCSDDIESVFRRCLLVCWSVRLSRYAILNDDLTGVVRQRARPPIGRRFSSIFDGSVVVSSERGLRPAGRLPAADRCIVLLTTRSLSISGDRINGRYTDPLARYRPLRRRHDVAADEYLTRL